MATFLTREQTYLEAYATAGGMDPSMVQTESATEVPTLNPRPYTQTLQTLHCTP